MAQGLEFEHRIYPIGAFSEREMVETFTDGLSAEEVSIDELMQDWRDKARAFEAMAPQKLEVLNSDLLPLNVKEETMRRVNSVLASYRYFIPPIFDLAFVPISKLITPQKSLSQDQLGRLLIDARGPLSDDENALLCLGTPLPPAVIDSTYLGSPKSMVQNRFEYNYQFLSDNPNVRFIPPLPFKPVRDINLAVEGAPFAYDAKVVPIAVGLGLPLVQVIKIPTGVDPQTKAATYKLVLGNGVHRAARLAELGNTHIAALVQFLRFEELPNPFIDGPKEHLLVPRPITITMLSDETVSRRLRWKKVRRTVKLHIAVSYEMF